MGGLGYYWFNVVDIDLKIDCGWRMRTMWASPLLRALSRISPWKYSLMASRTVSCVMRKLCLLMVVFEIKSNIQLIIHLHLIPSAWMSHYEQGVSVILVDWNRIAFFTGVKYFWKMKNISIFYFPFSIKIFPCFSLMTGITTRMTMLPGTRLMWELSLAFVWQSSVTSE